jgi:TalC/MipB family fructose-6-phosphate aldolase
MTDMTLFIDSAFLDDITMVARTVPVEGVTTNPSILHAAYERGQKLDHMTLLNELLQHIPGLIFMQPGSSDEDEMYQQAWNYVRVAPQRVIPKIPMTAAGMRVARRLKESNPDRYYRRIAFTAVTTVAQAYTAAIIGATYIIPYYGRLKNSGIDADQRISEMATVLGNAFDVENRPHILAASIKSPQDAERALLAGADDLTVSPQVLLEMVTDPQSEEAVARFQRDWQTLNTL